jgi:hypothetical protein
MKKILLFTVLIIGYCLPAFSQSGSQLYIDTTSVKFGIFNGTKTLGHSDTIDFKQLLNNREQYKYKLSPKLADKDVRFGRLSKGIIKAPDNSDNMPVVYPHGSFPMPVYKPDSTVRYTMLIKKY